MQLLEELVDLCEGNAMKGENTEYFFNTPESTVPEDQISRRHAVSRETGGTNVDHCSNQSRSATPKTPLSSLFLSVLNGNNTENLYKNEGGALYDALTKGCTSDSRDTLECPSQPRNLRMTAYSDFDSLVQDPTGVHDQYHSESCFSPKQDQSMYGYYYGHHNTHVGMPTNTVNLNVMQNEQFSRKETTNKHFYNIPNAAKTIVPSSHPQASHQMTMKKSSLPIIGSKQLSCFVPGDSSNISGASQSAAVFSREQNPSEYAVAYPGAINTEWKCSRQTGGSHEPTLDIRQQQQKAPFSSHPFRSPYTTVQDSGSLTKVNVNSSVCFDGEKTFTDLSNSRTNQPLTLHQRQLNPFHDFNSELTHTQVQNQIELRNSQNAPLKPFPPWSREEFDCTPNVTVVSDGKGGQSQFQFHSRWSKVKTDSEKIFENHLKKFQHLTSSQERKPRREKSFDSVLNGNNGDRESNSKKLEVARKNDKICEEDSKDSADEERASVFSCKWLGCDASYSDRNDLVRHIEKVHIDQRKADDLYICYWECCTRQTKPFNARYKLVIHMRVHSGEKPNKCTFPGCTKAFSRLENLKIHMRSHTGEKPYMCQFPSCPKAFSNSSDRAKHQRTHLDTKPYACQVPGCPKRYTDPSSLRKHFKQHLTGKVQQSTNNKAKQKPKANKMSKRDLLGEGVTRPMDYRQKVLESLQHGVNDSSVPPQHVPPEYMTSPWYNPENVAFYPFAQDVQFPMAEASTPEPSENTNGTFTQTLSSMEIPTFEEQLKPVTAAF